MHCSLFLSWYSYQVMIANFFFLIKKFICFHLTSLFGFGTYEIAKSAFYSQIFFQTPTVLYIFKNMNRGISEKPLVSSQRRHLGLIMMMMMLLLRCWFSADTKQEKLDWIEKLSQALLDLHTWSQSSSSAQSQQPEPSSSENLRESIL